MKVLVLGASGILGSQIYKTFKNEGYEIVGTGSELIDLDALDLSAVRSLIMEEKPDWIINCIGFTKQPSDSEMELCKKLNTDLPLFIASLQGELDFKLIHISTNGVFKGDAGPYKDFDNPDAEDGYGKSKRLGEPPDAMSIRTTFVGRSHRKVGLLEWILSAKGTISGFLARWNGFTAEFLSKLILKIVKKNLWHKGAFHLCTEKIITKHDLLVKLKKRFALDVDIVRDDSSQPDLSLVPSELQKSLGKILSIDEQIEEMKSNP